MLEHLEQGDVAETIAQFFESSNAVRPNFKSALTIQEVKIQIINGFSPFFCMKFSITLKN